MIVTMDRVQNALWNRDGSNVNLSFDMQKIADENERIVIGFATLDNLDLTSDIVTADASLKAFSRFRGNVRLQHDKSKPVGKVISFQPASYYDEATQMEYSGIQVAVRVSEGAEDVWKMCLDGTLTGFSIGGAVLKTSDLYREDIGKRVKVIEEYALLELSLVDSPANHLANIQIVKALSLDGMEKGYDSYNLFWCGIDRVATRSKNDSHVCPDCSTAMANMGSIEQNEDIKTQLDKVLKSLDIDMEGGQSNMADTTLTIEKGEDGAEIASVDEVSVTEGSVAAAPVEEAPEATEEATEEVATDEVAEGEGEDETPADANAEIKALIQQLAETVEASTGKVSKDATEIRAEVEKVSSELTGRFEKLEKELKTFQDAQDELKEKISTTTAGLEETRKRLDDAVEGTAMQKSVDVATTTKTPEAPKSKFQGLFSGDYGRE
ncbi:head maturation protease [Rhodococcus phage Trina]|uniref:Capsid maturation protease n=1 Tax=Rhodococcus phage Trina TaxID=2027905 RepID=A0A2D0ZM63_9CAUD|nr:head maturation protease [Rhodococcus phage Trina]ASZ74885.1 capsid maturation protease [Rhodococcus phage Trina]